MPRHRLYHHAMLVRMTANMRDAIEDARRPGEAVADLVRVAIESELAARNISSHKLRDLDRQADGGTANG